MELRLEHLVKDFSGTKAVNDVSITIQDGKLTGLLGPSGCGKSSILYLLDGLVPHMYEGELTGRVLLEGEDITSVPPRDRCDRIGFVMQNPESQFCTFTVEEELAFGMENLGVAPEAMKGKIEEALAFVGMSGYEKTDLNNLSGGQKLQTNTVQYQCSDEMFVINLTLEKG